MPRTLFARSAILGVALTLAAIGVAQAATNRYLAYSFAEPASAGLDVKPPLDEFDIVASGRIVVSTDWQRLSAKAGQLRFLSSRGTNCRYRVTFSLRKRLAPASDPAQYVAAALPAASRAYVLDSGAHGSRAFAVVRRKTSQGVRVDGLSSGVITRRSDIAPAGQVLWGDIRVTATSRPGDECHSGTYREALGPQMGDVLANGKMNFRFVKTAR
ncbi:MAG: hypothetical protein H0W96_00450 [Solirubrobacterales bacterium]|nr:hypothetical protein [Solirubrobacterales bacterium]